MAIRSIDWLGLVLKGALTACLFAFVPVQSVDLLFLPKELALALVALVCSAAALASLFGSEKRITTPAPHGTATLELLVVSLGLWVVIAALINRVDLWVASRPVTIVICSAGLFVVALRLSASAAGSVLRFGAHVASLAVMLAVLQALGVFPNVSPPGQFPGATVGSRNAVGHLAALTIPILLWVYRRSERRQMLPVFLALAMSSSALVISRSRVAWIAAMLMTAVALTLVFIRRPFSKGKRVFAPIVTIVVGAVVPLAFSAEGSWINASAFADSFGRLTEFSEGSGRGRLLQARVAAAIAIHNPVLGVGFGQWPIAYFQAAPVDDPSLSLDAMRPARWMPQSDWTGIAVEAGLPALGLLAAVGWLIFVRAAQRLRQANSGTGDVATPFVVMLLVLGAMTSMMGDPILRHPALGPWVATMLGSLVAIVWIRPVDENGRTSAVRKQPLANLRVLISRRVPLIGMIGLAVISLIGAVTSARRLQAAWLSRGVRTITDVERIAALDPGRPDAQFQLAIYWINAGDCTRAIGYLNRARNLSPSPAVDMWAGMCERETTRSGR